MLAERQLSFSAISWEKVRFPPLLASLIVLLHLLLLFPALPSATLPRHIFRMLGPVFRIRSLCVLFAIVSNVKTWNTALFFDTVGGGGGFVAVLLPFFSLLHLKTYCTLQLLTCLNNIHEGCSTGGISPSHLFLNLALYWRDPSCLHRR